MYLDANKAAAKVSGHAKAVNTILVATAYEQDDLPACRRSLDKCEEADPDTLVNWGCVEAKAGKFEEARAKFQEAIQALGYKPELQV